VRLGLFLAFLICGQLVFALLTQAIILTQLGAGVETDSYVAAQALPLIAFSILGTSLQNTWQPILALVDGREWHRRTALALGQAVPIFVAVSLGLTLATPLLVRILFPGFSDGQNELTSLLAQILMITLFFNGCGAILTAAGRAINRFVMVEAVPAGATFIVLCLMPMALQRFGIVGAAWLVVIRSIATFGIMWWLLGRPLPDLRPDSTKNSALRQLRPLLAGSAIYKLGPLVDRFWSSLTMAGEMTLYNFAQTGVGAAATVLERTICAPVVPNFARWWTAGELALLRRQYLWTIAKVWICVGAIAVALISFYPALTSVPDFGINVSVSQVMALYEFSFALLGFLGVAASGTIAVAVFYAMGDTRTPALIHVAGFLFGTALKSIVFMYYGLFGMALATSAYYIINFLISLALLERRLGVQVFASR
jgi:putative peptidoglycan lipid II flippase